MKQARRLIWALLTIGECLCLSCGRSGEAPLGQHPQQLSGEDYQRSKDAALAQAEREYEEALTNPPPREVPLPNFPAGPGLPQPLGLNFYERRKYYPGYLLCTYDVSENHYDQSNEPAWFKAALLQIRASGPEHFPPFDWVAIIMRNREEPSKVNTYELAHKVGAIFKASEVFDSSDDPGLLVAKAQMDRRPFKFDPQQPTPGEQDRWLIVERHAATTRAAASSDDK